MQHRPQARVRRVVSATACLKPYLHSLTCISHVPIERAPLLRQQSQNVRLSLPGNSPSPQKRSSLSLFALSSMPKPNLFHTLASRIRSKTRHRWTSPPEEDNEMPKRGYQGDNDDEPVAKARQTGTLG